MIKGGETMRVDSEFADLARKIKELNEINLRQATREIARAAKLNMSTNKKITREIKF